MRGTILTFIFLFFTCSAFAVPSVKKVDLQKYMGQWFEVAHIPNSSQKNCFKNSKARYKLREDGKIDVRNSCIKKGGQRQVADGVGQIVDSETHAELKISFVPLFKELGLFSGQYKILSLDPNYQYAIIGEDSLENGWILSRKSGLPLPVFSQLENEIRSLGYDSCSFVTSIQDTGFFTKRTPLCELVKNNPNSLVNSNIL